MNYPSANEAGYNGDAGWHNTLSCELRQWRTRGALPAPSSPARNTGWSSWRPMTPV